MNARPALSEIRRFVRAHVWHLLLLAPGLLLATLLHEAAHAAAVAGQRGQLEQFTWIPSLQEWGYVTYRFPEGVAYSELAISIAPYLLALGLAGIATLASFRRQPWSYRVASVWYIWGFLVPLAEIANTMFAWLVGADNDLSAAFGRPAPGGFIAVGCVVPGCLLWGGWLQRRLYRERALGLGAYATLSLSTVIFVVVVSVWLARSYWGGRAGAAPESMLQRPLPTRSAFLQCTTRRP